MNQIQYNERSWAIDLISAINAYAKDRKRPIVRAGGEATLTGQRNLFPDVLLYGDDVGERVRQGWELKMPDTVISDNDFLKNAKEKAERLRVNSFLVWNVNEAALYVRQEDDFILYKQWGPIGIQDRRKVKSEERKWIGLLHIILSDLNDFFENGTLRSAGISYIFDDSFLSEIIQEFGGVTAQSIHEKVERVASLEAVVRTWWRLNATEYGKKRDDEIDYEILAKIALTNWINRFLFCHYLKNQYSAAKKVEIINGDTNMVEAKKIFEGITNSCDFLQIFRLVDFAEHIGEEAWHALCEVNRFLTNLKIETVPQAMLHKIIEKTLHASRRKVAGQYATPMPLARLLVTLAMDDRVQSVLDPCCGTGTIARAAYDLKRSKGLSVQDALATVWASDKFQFPLQLCTIALADPAALGQIIQVFQEDVLDLRTGVSISFVDPSTGESVVKALPEFQTIVSNLPFVRFEELKITNPNAASVLEQETSGLSGKSDLFAYIVYALDRLLSEGGRIGVIVSNSWLGANWGEKFRLVLLQKFHVCSVITSSSGRWFDNADVVTNVLILEKRGSHTSEITTFTTTKLPISAWSNANIETIADTALLSANSRSSLQLPEAQFVSYTQQEISTLEKITLGWSCFFTDVRWLEEIQPKLIRIASMFNVARGERRGWNKLFYPSANHGIESEYIRPVLKSTRNLLGYIAEPDAEAFCCSDSTEELATKGKSGALRWIRLFENESNESGESLSIVLARPMHQWYEMSSDSQADIVLSVNPNDRLFFAKMQERGFVDQRLIPFKAKSGDCDIELAHALLNSILSLFLVEAAGFGRGLGALDLNPTKIKNGFLMWNPESLSSENKEHIKSLFVPLLERNVCVLPEELTKEDRTQFDEAVFDAFGLRHLLPTVRTSLLDLYYIRKAAEA